MTDIAWGGSLLAMARGVVKFRSEKGWGRDLLSELPPGRDAWVHFSVIEV
jgi:CspA family cold shock protein